MILGLPTYIIHKEQQGVCSRSEIAMEQALAKAPTESCYIGIELDGYNGANTLAVFLSKHPELELVKNPMSGLLFKRKNCE
jgi:hypothetical protein